MTSKMRYGMVFGSIEEQKTTGILYMVGIVRFWGQEPLVRSWLVFSRHFIARYMAGAGQKTLKNQLISIP